MPPLAGVAVKVILVPAQTLLPGLAAILTDGASTGLTVIEMVLDVAVTGVAHSALLVSIHVTTSPFARDAFE